MYLRNTLRLMRREREIMEARRREQMRQRHLLIRAAEEAEQAARLAMVKPTQGYCLWIRRRSESTTAPPPSTTHTHTRASTLRLHSKLFACDRQLVCCMLACFWRCGLLELFGIGRYAWHPTGYTW